MIEREAFIAMMSNRGITSGPALWKRAMSLVEQGYTSPNQITRDTFPDVKSNMLGIYRNALRWLEVAEAV